MRTLILATRFPPFSVSLVPCIIPPLCPNFLRPVPPPFSATADPNASLLGTHPNAEMSTSGNGMFLSTRYYLYQNFLLPPTDTRTHSCLIGNEAGFLLPSPTPIWQLLTDLVTKHDYDTLSAYATIGGMKRSVIFHDHKILNTTRPQVIFYGPWSVTWRRQTEGRIRHLLGEGAPARSLTHYYRVIQLVVSFGTLPLEIPGSSIHRHPLVAWIPGSVFFISLPYIYQGVSFCGHLCIALASGSCTLIPPAVSISKDFI